MQDRRIYTLTQGKLKRAYCEGLKVTTENTVSMCKEQVHFMVLHRFCSYQPESRWGRFHCKTQLPTNCIFKIRAFAVDASEEEISELEQFFSDSSISAAEKKKYFMNAGGREWINQQDILLYDVKGAYLFLSLEVVGEGQGCIGEMRLDSQGDNFMQTFPEIYQEEGSFFHRFMSVFSSIYQDLNHEIYHIDQYLDLDTAPKELVVEYASWLGLTFDGEFLEEHMLRKMVKEAYQLNKIKGTKQVLMRLIALLLEEKAMIIERNRIEHYMNTETRKTYQKLYGKNQQDLVILVHHKADEKLQAQVMFLLKQFKPVRSQIKLIFYQDCVKLDSYGYLDKNTALAKKQIGGLDQQISMNGICVLQ